ncbi:putative inactive ATP-dependent zinc metalloprotease FTSHI 1, chloroplastic isoform X3 [Primulina tabacum]|uniref:putative inactive ATP-dependent zinc metalloprotease FTSHI 1, chloroplastic isoform X3 n=1 Tax=Primulina tabacum TaxID=48773 RepID=UPI003F5A4F6E
MKIFRSTVRVIRIMRLGVNQVKDLFETYKGPHNEIERRQGIFRESKDQLYNAATQARGTTLKQLLIELDGFDTCKVVIFLGATNRMDLLDPALLRPGRFDSKIRIRPPNSKGRLEILQVHARKVKFSDTVDLSTYANNLPGAKLAQLLQEAALVAVRKGRAAILQSDMDNAVDRLTVGPKRVGIELNQQGQCRRATSEVGTVLTSHLLRRVENPKVECCDRVSIHPRGQVLLGSRTAEEVIFGRKSFESISLLSCRRILAYPCDMENPTVVHGEPSPWRKKVKFVGPLLDFEGSLYDDYDLIEPPFNFKLDNNVAKRMEELMRNMHGNTVALLKRHNVALLRLSRFFLISKRLMGTKSILSSITIPQRHPQVWYWRKEIQGAFRSLKRST